MGGGKNPFLKPPHATAVPDMGTTWCLEGTAWFCDVFGPFWVMHICSSIWRGVNREEPHGSTDTLCVCSFYPGTTRSLKLLNWFSRYLLSRFPGTQVTTQAWLAPVSYLPSIWREAPVMSSPLWAWQYCFPAPGGFPIPMDGLMCVPCGAIHRRDRGAENPPAAWGVIYLLWKGF